MTALTTLRAAGLTVRAEGDTVRVGPRERLTPEIRAQVAEHKAALLEALAGEARPEVDAGALAALCREVFKGDTARELVTVEARHVRRAIEIGALDPVLARASVLLAYRNAEGRCLLAVPREKYDGIEVLKVFHEVRGGTTG